MSQGASQEGLTILVTGGTGQVGHELIRELGAVGTVLAPSRRELDLASTDSIRDCVRHLRPTLIVNAGAFTAVDAAEDDESTARRVNTDAPAILAEEGLRLGAAMIHYSTDYVFDGSKGAPYTEDDPTNPRSVYGVTKRDGELAVAASGAPYLVLRTSWVYGLRGRNFLTSIFQQAREREELRVVRDQVGTPTWSRMIAMTTARIVTRGVANGLIQYIAANKGIYHLASADGTSRHGFAEAALALDPQRQAGRRVSVLPILTSEYPTRAPRPANSSLDVSRLSRTFGLRLPGWREQLRLALTS
ncbi:MAG: dTDP-4-dehydrorhamnose reductase [Gemmatimonadota bacterium]